MTYRGVLLLMYDLPVISSEDRKETERFRKNIRRLGYVPMQKSVYVKLLRQYAGISSEMEKIEFIKPESGLIQVIPLTLAEFKKLNTVRGEGFDMSFFSDDVIVV